MTREETRAAILIMEAYLDGYEIQHRMKKCDSRSGLNPDWCDTDAPWWDFDSYEYRIKPTAKLRPWTADEVPLGAQCRKIGDSKRFLIVRTSDESMRSEWAENCEHSTDGGKTWLPCGVDGGVEMNHLGDTNKMVSDTPRTNAESFFPHDSKYQVCDADFSRQLERELNAANDRIKRLEEAGEKMVDEPMRKHRRWILDEAKEAKP